MNVIQVVNRFLRKNSSTILTVIGASGTIATAVLAVRATPKALELIETAKEEKGEELTKLEVINVAWPVYVPSVAVCMTTIACIFGANVLDRRQQASLVSAYGLLDQCYKEYREKVSDLFGEDADRKIHEEIARDKYKDSDSHPQLDTKLFYEEHYGYFKRTMLEVTDAEYRLNEHFLEDGIVSLNDFFELLALDDVDGADLIGWEQDYMSEFYGYAWIKFEHQLVTMDDGTECYIINNIVKPYSIL